MRASGPVHTVHVARLSSDLQLYAGKGRVGLFRRTARNSPIWPFPAYNARADEILATRMVCTGSCSVRAGDLRQRDHLGIEINELR